MPPIDVHYDMETQDPDDFFTLCFLTAHPAVRLRGVTLTPGSRHQVGVVREVLARTDHTDVPVGAGNPDHEKKCVSSFHYKYLGDIPPADPDGWGWEVLAQVLADHPDLTVITGAPLSNLRYLLTRTDEVEISRWVGQGGFAGDEVVDPEHRLEKFRGMNTCPTFNFNGDPKGAFLMLESDRVHSRQLVSKNVCHGVVYDRNFHEKVAAVKDTSPGMTMVYEGMDLYLQKRSGKKFHDPLAACTAIDRDICTFREVEVYRERGKWGARLQEGTDTWISVAIDMDRFIEVFTRVET